MENRRIAACVASLALAALLAVCTAPAGRAATQRGDTLFGDLGGRPGIDRIVDHALALYFSDPRLATFFDNINPDFLKPRFAAYICRIAGGPCVYRGRSMAAAHKGLHVDEAAFNAVAEDLQIAMGQCGTPFHTQNRLLARLAPLERDIVTR
jgi:hemoglobin